MTPSLFLFTVRSCIHDPPGNEGGCAGDRPRHQRGVRGGARVPQGRRTSAAEILALVEHGTFLVAESQEGRIPAAVHVRVAGEVGYFGMLAVDAEARGAGLGRSTNSAFSRPIRVVHMAKPL